MNPLKKIQQQSEKTRKVIFWLAIIIVAAALIFVWLKTAQSKLKEFDMSGFMGDLNLPEIEMPELKIMETSEEILEEIKQYAETATTTE